LFFLSELRQISTKFDNFWQTNGQDDKIMRGALIMFTVYCLMDPCGLTSNKDDDDDDDDD